MKIFHIFFLDERIVFHRRIHTIIITKNKYYISYSYDILNIIYLIIRKKYCDYNIYMI